MAFYNLISFAILTLELVTFLVVIFPLPFAWRRAMFKAIAESHIIARLQYGLKITFIFIAVLFADAVNQMLKIHREREALATSPAGVAATPDMRAQADYRSRKFLSERNFYLHGSCLVLSLILSRTYSLVLDLIRAQEELAVLQAQTGTGGPEAEKLAQPGKLLSEVEKPKVKPQVVDKKKE
ncbi:hypothetical protein JCM9279_002596 [Rhodotorula babjevae]